MSESSSKAGLNSAAIPTVKIAQETPVVFADGIASQSFAFGVTKLIFSRFDPNPTMTGPQRHTSL